MFIFRRYYSIRGDTKLTKAQVTFYIHSDLTKSYKKYHFLFEKDRCAGVVFSRVELEPDGGILNGECY